MIKQIKSSEIKKFIDSNPNTVLLDVRTEDEWNTVGRPDTKDFGIESYFITISQDSSFLENVKKKIKKDSPILVSCAAGGRSLIAANLFKRVIRL